MIIASSCDVKVQAVHMVGISKHVPDFPMHMIHKLPLLTDFNESITCDNYEMVITYKGN